MTILSAKVKNMFADIADDYDRINTILSFGVQNGWRKKAVLESGAKEITVLTVAQA
jgi:demethylmenaquinone methyltransferase/2-methoxy-6-polyprenyl-1,4-benzoquinol methylase